MSPRPSMLRLPRAGALKHNLCMNNQWPSGRSTKKPKTISLTLKDTNLNFVSPECLKFLPSHHTLSRDISVVSHALCYKRKQKIKCLLIQRGHKTIFSCHKHKLSFRSTIQFFYQRYNALQFRSTANMPNPSQPPSENDGGL